MLAVCETFSSIQGESTFAGRPCFFIRLAGCSCACSYCDTEYAKAPGREHTLSELLQLARQSQLKLVEVTGGEPMEQSETPLLCRSLLNAGFEVLLETNGTIPLDAVPAGVHRIVDCKLPSSGMAERGCEHNYELLGGGDEVKFVVGSRLDFEYAMAVVSKFRLAEAGCELLISPVWGKVDLPALAQWVLESRQPLRLQLQLHKIIWGDRRGV
ncbi:MAG: radical SAM protein [Lentisphaeria bacterium]|nr:radical SAM protein [Lentisphaeria bacterium]